MNRRDALKTVAYSVAGAGVILDSREKTWAAGPHNSLAKNGCQSANGTST